MHAYDTVTEAIINLKQRGYILDFNLEENELVCFEPSLKLHPEQFHIHEVYRFEDNTDPDDQAILFAIETDDGHKGILLNAYGAKNDSIADALVQKLKIFYEQKKE
jgi:hypothetical protein